jgi:hypothetical protein
MNPGVSPANETVDLLQQIPGGAALLPWFGGAPRFGDSEVLDLCLNRTGLSRLRLVLYRAVDHTSEKRELEQIVVAFSLRDMIDVDLKGFSRQNVVGDLVLRRARHQHLDPSLLGIGSAPGEVEIVIEPCAGAFGVIRATIASISFAPPKSTEERCLSDQQK